MPVEVSVVTMLGPVKLYVSFGCVGVMPPGTYVDKLVVQAQLLVVEVFELMIFATNALLVALVALERADVPPLAANPVQSAALPPVLSSLHAAPGVIVRANDFECAPLVDELSRLNDIEVSSEDEASWPVKAGVPLPAKPNATEAPEVAESVVPYHEQLSAPVPTFEAPAGPTKIFAVEDPLPES
jgi:hypothetical protein